MLAGRIGTQERKPAVVFTRSSLAGCLKALLKDLRIAVLQLLEKVGDAARMGHLTLAASFTNIISSSVNGQSIGTEMVTTWHSSEYQRPHTSGKAIIHDSSLHHGRLNA